MKRNNRSTNWASRGSRLGCLRRWMSASISGGSVFGMSLRLAIVGRLGRSLSQTPPSAKSESDWIHYVTLCHRRETFFLPFLPLLFPHTGSSLFNDARISGSASLLFRLNRFLGEIAFPGLNDHFAFASFHFCGHSQVDSAIFPIPLLVRGEISERVTRTQTFYRLA
jgi:hypothetical protein